MILGVILAAGYFLAGRFLTTNLADAVRYFSAGPSYVETRNWIRTEGIKLLIDHHNAGKYDRIVVVGHSLGSVIGYDILRHAWNHLSFMGPECPQNSG